MKRRFNAPSPVCLAALVLLLSAGAARAQDAYRVSIGGALTMSHQADRQTKGDLLAPHGTSTGVNLLAAVTLARRLALEAEVSTAGTVADTASWSHPGSNGDATATHRDTIASGLVRIHAARFLDLLAGGGVVVARTSAVQVSRSYWPGIGVRTTTRTERIPGAVRPALTLGIDAPIRVGANVDVLPILRLYVLSRPDYESGPADRPLHPADNIVTRFGGGLRVRF